MKFLFFALILLFSSLSCAFADFGTVHEKQLQDAINSNKLVLVFIRSNEECDESCQDSLRVLTSVEHASTFLGLKVMNVQSSTLLKAFEPQDQPRLFLYRDGVPLAFESLAFEMEEIMEWIQENQDVVQKKLNDDNFEHLTQASTGSTTGDWFILFYSKKCAQYIVTWDTLGVRLKQHKIVGVVNVDSSPNLRKRFGIVKCPVALFFRLGKMYPYNLPLNDLTSLVNFAEGWYKNAPSQPVPPEQTPFDRLTEDVASWLKENPWKFVATSGVLAFILFLIIFVRHFLMKSKPKLF